MTADDRAAARAAAGKSMVLLKNDGATLPLNPAKSVAVIGPLGNNQHDMLGPWWGQGRDADAVTVFEGIKAQNPNTTFTQGCTILDKEPPNNTPADECGSDAGFAAAVAAANAADQVVLALGESRGQSGESASRSEIGLPGKQQELIDAIKATGKPFVVVLFNGRPLTLAKVAASVAGDPRGLVPGHRGRQRGGGRALRQGQSGRQAARCPSRGRSGRSRSTTTTSPPAGRATPAPSRTRATATSRRATRSTRSASD